MYKLLFALTLSLFTTFSFATNRCDKQPNKAKVEACYKQLVVERKEALEEYHQDIMDSSNIPANVKATISTDYKSFMRNISSMCPDNSCIEAAMLEHMKDMYNETRRYTVPQ